MVLINGAGNTGVWAGPVRKTMKNETEELEEKAYILGVVWLTQANEEEK